MEVHISTGVVKVRGLTGKDLVKIGTQVDQNRVLELGVETINGENTTADVFTTADWTERDLAKVLKKILELSELSLEGEQDYTVLSKTDDTITVQVSQHTYEMRMLRQKDLLSLPKGETPEIGLRKLAMAIVKIDGEEVTLSYKDLFDWPAGRITTLLQAYNDFVSEGIDEDF